MSLPEQSAKVGHEGRRDLLLACAVILAILLWFFYRSFQADQVLFANDGPLGALVAYAKVTGQAFAGNWHYLNWIGTQEVSALPSATYVMYWLWGPLAQAKFIVPLSLFALGLGAWLFLRELKLSKLACVLGGLAAMLNTDPFSYSCWGLPTLAFCMAATFFALAALVRWTGPTRWLWTALAGFALGMGIMEGFDNGAIFSLYIAAFVLFQTWTNEGTAAQRLTKGLARVAVVALCAAFISAHGIASLVTTQIKGIAGMEQDTQSKEQRWDEATMWSLPKIEALRVVIPGLFGYRMDTADGGNYWGSVGQTPGVPQSRHSGSGVYAGVLVLLLAAFAVAQAARKSASPFSDPERKHIWFWTGAAAISLLLAFGRNAPFYQFFYQLPYFSTIRNPIKFMHPFTVAVVVLFGYGVEGLVRGYLQRNLLKSSSWSAQVKGWWKTVTGFDRRWALGSAGVLAGTGLACLLYVSSRRELERFLQSIASESYGFPASLVPQVASFSTKEAGWSLLFLALGVGAVLLIISGALSGRRARWAGALLGLILVTDLARANAPWVVYYNYQEKYASNPVIDRLRELCPPDRVAARISPRGGPYLVSQEAQQLFARVVDMEWLQQHFQYYRVPSLDIVQMPRVPQLDLRFMQALSARNQSEFWRVGRLWQLTDTRYILGMKGFVDVMNQQIDPNNRSFTVKASFDFAPRSPTSTGTSPEDITTVIRPEGQFAIFEFGAALPKAKLYSHWEVATDDAAALQKLADASFDPRGTVLVANAIGPSAQPGGKTNQNTGAVTLSVYEPKRVGLHAEAAVPSVLLLNEKFDPNWKVSIDGQPAPLLRCNYIMRGVSVPPGKHSIEFRFDPPHGTLYVSLAGIAIAIGLCGFLAANRARIAPAPEQPLVLAAEQKAKG
jgi:hypothetical protein